MNFRECPDKEEGLTMKGMRKVFQEQRDEDQKDRSERRKVRENKEDEECDEQNYSGNS